VSGLTVTQEQMNALVDEYQKTGRSDWEATLAVAALAMQFERENLAMLGTKLKANDWAILVQQYGMVQFIISGTMEVSIRGLHREFIAQGKRVAELERQVVELTSERFPVIPQAVMAQVLADGPGMVGEGAVVGAELVVAERDGLRAECERLKQHADALTSQLVQESRFHDEVTADILTRHGASEDERDRWKGLAIRLLVLAFAGAARQEPLAKEVLELKADNAVLLGTLGAVARAPRPMGPPECAWCGTQVHHKKCPVGWVLSRTHRGAALLDELSDLREKGRQAEVDHRAVNDALVKARNDGRREALEEAVGIADFWDMSGMVAKYIKKDLMELES